jgi:hypothetical protein
MSLGINESTKREQPWHCLRIGIWNVLSLYRPGGIAGDKMVGKWHFGKEELCNIL